MFGNNHVSPRMGVSRLYTRFIAVFIVVAIALIFVIFYFSLSKALIRITPRVTTVSSDFITDVETSPQTPTPGAIKGTLFTTEISMGQSYPATGTKDLEGDVVGTVTIINTLDRNQPLVQKTRVSSVDGVVLRIKERVDVPAKGSVDVDVYADNPATFEKIAPGKFTIPGLSESLQTKVYAESKSTIASKPGSLKVVKLVDINRAKEDLLTKVYAQAQEKFTEEMGTAYIAIVVGKSVVSEEIGAKVDDIADTFPVNVKVKVTLIGIDQNDVVKVGVERLKQLVPQDMQLRNLKLDNLSYVVQNYDEKAKTANIRIHAEGESVIKETSPILEKAKLAGLSARGVELYLASYDQIQDVEVILSPFWVKKIPSLEDNITIEIKESPTAKKNTTEQSVIEEPAAEQPAP